MSSIIDELFTKIKYNLDQFKVFKEIDVSDDVIKITTNLLNTQESYLDVFITKEFGKLFGSKIIVSDSGQSVYELICRGNDPTTSDSSEKKLSKIVQTYGLNLDGCTIVTKVSSEEQVLDAILKIYSCSNQMLNTEFAMKQKSAEERLSKPIKAMLDEKKIPYTKDKALIGKYNHSMKIDYAVKFNGFDKLIQVMATSSEEDYARQVANRITVNWLATDKNYPKEYKLTAYDPSRNCAGDDSIRLLGEQSIIIPIENNNTEQLYQELQLRH